MAEPVKSFGNLHKYFFLFFLYFSWILYAFSLVLYNKKDLRWVSKLVQQIIRCYVGLFLVIKYNPYTKGSTKASFTAFDRQVIYNAGIFILLSTVFNKIIEKYIGYAKADIKASYLYNYITKDKKTGV